MRIRPIEFCLAMLISISFVVEADALEDPLAKLWAGEAVFEEQPETIGNFDDHMHFLSMFWDSDPVDTPGDPHFKAYYIGEGFDTSLASSYNGINFTNVGTVLPNGPPGSYDEAFASFPGVWKDNGTYYLVHEAGGVDVNQFPVNIGLATSTDGVNFTKQGLILNEQPGTWESVHVGTPSLYKENDTWYLYYHSFDGTDVQVGLATGTDLMNLTRVQSTPIIPTSAAGWDSGTVGKRSRITKEGNYYYMAYEGTTDLNPTFAEASSNSGMARSTDLINWEKMPLNPILMGNACCFGYDGPEMITIDDELYIYYRNGANQTFRAKLVLADEPISEVLNFGFEDGNFIDWGFVTPNAVVVVDNGPSASGSNAALITVTNPQSFEQAVSKAIPILPGEELDLSFDYKTLPGASGDWHVQLRYWDGVGANGFSDGGGGTFLGQHHITLGHTEGLWDTEFLTALASPDPAATHVDVRFIANAFATFDGTALADNFILRKNVAGDFNEDGVVDGNDFLTLQRGLGTIYNALHLAEWEANYGNVAAVSAASAVPEPTTLALTFLAIAGFARLPRRR